MHLNKQKNKKIKNKQWWTEKGKNYWTQFEYTSSLCRAEEKKYWKFINLDACDCFVMHPITVFIPMNMNSLSIELQFNRNLSSFVQCHAAPN